MTEENRSRPTAGEVEERTAAVEVAERRIRGLIPYDTESRPIDGFTETIAKGALRGAKLDRLRATIDHADRGVPLARYPVTLSVEDREDGFHWSFEPPRSRPDVIEAIERGDIAGSSWRMRVAQDSWQGERRTVEAIGELIDITLAASQEPAYPQAAVEYRTTSENNDGGSAAREEGDTMPPTTDEDGAAENRTENENDGEERAEDRSEERTEERAESTGSLRVEDRVSAPRRGLAAELRSRGFPSERAAVTFDTFVEFRALSVSGADNLAPSRQVGVGLGSDERYAFPIFPRVGVDAGTTSVDVVRQSGRTLASSSDVVRALAATTAKPETDSDIVVEAEALKQVANVAKGIPNVYLETGVVASIIENDLRLAVSEGLDKLVLDELANADNEDPTSVSLIVAVRNAIETIQAAGYSADALILDPTSAASLDTLVADTGTEFYVFSPGQPAGNIWGLQRRISKSAPAPIVCDSRACGRLFASPVSLQRFEENDGGSNSSLLRMELSALFGVERLAAAVRIAAA